MPARASSHAPGGLPSYAPEPVPTERNAPRAFSSAGSGSSLDDADLTWTDELPTLDPPPPPSTEELERDRLLAAYLAEHTPFPQAALHEWSSPPGEAPARAEADVDGRRRGDALSQRPMPDSRATAPITMAPISSSSFGATRRPRAPIPREEPEDDGGDPPAPEGRDR